MKFPIDVIDQFAKQFVPRWTVNDAPTIAAYNALVQKVGSAVVMVHSQSGNFGFQAALAAPDKVSRTRQISLSGATMSKKAQLGLD